MKRIATCLFFLLLAFMPLSAEEWTSTQKILAGTLLVGRAVDALQTFAILDDNKYHETNAFINNKEEAVVFLFGTAAIGLTVAHFVPKWRTPILVVGNIITWSYVEHNHRIGVRISF